MYFGMKNYLKSNRYHTAKHTLRNLSKILECIILKIYHKICTFEVKSMQIVLLFLCLGFFLLSFTLQGFNEAIWYFF